MTDSVLLVYEATRERGEQAACRNRLAVGSHQAEVLELEAVEAVGPLFGLP